MNNECIYITKKRGISSSTCLRMVWKWGRSFRLCFSMRIIILLSLASCVRTIAWKRAFSKFIQFYMNSKEPFVSSDCHQASSWVKMNILMTVRKNRNVDRVLSNWFKWQRISSHSKLVFHQNRPTIGKETKKWAKLATVASIKRDTIIAQKWYRAFLRIVILLHHFTITHRF